jgi:hypothetical protein
MDMRGPDHLFAISSTGREQGDAPPAALRSTRFAWNVMKEGLP